MGVIYEDATYRSDAKAEGLHDTAMLRCGNGHTLMVGLPARERGWIPRLGLESVCQVCMKPIRGSMKHKSGPRQHPGCHRNKTAIVAAQM